MSNKFELNGDHMEKEPKATIIIPRYEVTIEGTEGTFPITQIVWDLNEPNTIIGMQILMPGCIREVYSLLEYRKDWLDKVIIREVLI